MVRAKKSFGQHFLINAGVADKIVDSLTGYGGYSRLLEVGPGTGVLTERLVNKKYQLTAIEVDRESLAFLKSRKEFVNLDLIEADFLKLSLDQFGETFGIIGNFPYNISSQILFRILEYRNNVVEVVGMLQREVARRIASKEGSKEYGILSVLLQCWYDIELLFDVAPGSFKPPPKVVSSVVRLQRNSRTALDCDESLMKTLVKQGFQNRRKTLWNALKPINLPEQLRKSGFMDKRAEQLSVNDFIQLTRQVEEWKKK